MDCPKNTIRSLLIFMAFIALTIAGATARAAQPGQWNLEIYGGWYAAGDLQKLNDVEGGLDDTLEALGVEPGDDLTFGGRAGRRQAANWGWEVSVGKFDYDDASDRFHPPRRQTAFL